MPGHKCKQRIFAIPFSFDFGIAAIFLSFLCPIWRRASEFHAKKKRERREIERSKSNWTIVEIDTEDIGFHAKAVLHTAGITHKRTSCLIVSFDVRYVCAVMRSMMMMKKKKESKSRICSVTLSF